MAEELEGHPVRVHLRSAGGQAKLSEPLQPRDLAGTLLNWTWRETIQFRANRSAPLSAVILPIGTIGCY
jgi:hypothetical protein